MKKYVVYNANGKDIIGGMAANGSGVSYEELPIEAQKAIDDGTYEYVKETTVTSKFIPVLMTYYIRRAI